MCGRFASARSDQDVATLFRFDKIVGPERPPSWNIAPTQDARVIVERSESGDDDGERSAVVERELRTMRWGLVPHWAKDPKIGTRMINARVETVAEKPAFRKAFSRRRLIVPMDGYYEWETITEPAGLDSGRRRPRKQPYYLTNPDGSMLAAAGLYEKWYGSDERLWTFTVITTEAPDALGHIHDRSPVLLPQDYWADWLDPTLTDTAEITALLDSIPTSPLTPTAVGSAVGNVKNDGPALVEPLPDSPLGLW